ncbi:MAG: site-2 protease family protein [Alphaproteobacteria bacterium]|nr:site-2 protease family protein [Alphaproteobacteria bacterium]
MAAPEILSIVSFVVVALLAITLHEAAHAWVAAACGDDTARQLGRVSFNPLRHIDPVGTILLPGFLFAVNAPFLFGWAKPVPVAWSRLRHPRRDMMLVAAAGPAANFVLAALSAVAVQIVPDGAGPWLADALGASVQLNLILGVLNLIPVPPLDGSKVVAGLLPEPWAQRYLGFGRRRAAKMSPQQTETPLNRPADPSYNPPSSHGVIHAQEAERHQDREAGQGAGSPGTGPAASPR